MTLAAQALAQAAGPLTATVEIWGSNDKVDAVLLGTMTFAGATLATDGFGLNVPWKFLRPVVTALTGAGARLDVLINNQRPTP